jgi:hypothetical protein
MRTQFLILAALACPSALADPPVISGSLDVNLAAWSAECTPVSPGELPDCGLPAASAPLEELQLELAPVYKPGEAASVSALFQLGAETEGRLTVFSLYPAQTSPFPPYLQIRVELTAPVRALCAVSVRYARPLTLPPLICASIQEDGLAQHGVTFSFPPAQ